MRKILALLLLMALAVPAMSSYAEEEKVEVRLSDGTMAMVSPDTARLLDVLRRRKPAMQATGQTVTETAKKVSKPVEVKKVAEVTPPKAVEVQEVKVTPPKAVEATQAVQKSETVDVPALIAELQSNPPQAIAEEVPVEYPEYLLENEVQDKEGKTKAFNEFSAWGGLWKNPSYGSRGMWAQAEYFRKVSPRQMPEDFGLGGIAKLDRGKSDAGYKWGYVALGPDASYWSELSLSEAYQVKLRLPYRFDRTGDRPSGFMPGLYTEYSKILGVKDTLILSGETWLFKNDSYLGFQATWEHWLNKDMKLRAGGMANWNFLNDGSHFTWGPTLGLKFWNKLTIGGTLGLSRGGGPTLGAFVGYDYNGYLEALLSKQRQDAVQQKSGGDEESSSVEMGKVALNEAGEDYYSTLPAGEGVTITQVTLADDIRQQKEGEGK